MTYMLCQHCKAKNATTYYTQTINGEKREIALCDDCAKQFSGNFGFFDPFSFSLDNFFSQILSPHTKAVEGGTGTADVCSMCGSTLREISQTGKVGCPECYHKFADALMPSIQRIHGQTRHSGKVPRSAGAHLRLQSRLTELEGKLKQAVAEQRYEEAAKLRDEINSLKEQVERCE